MDEGEIKWKALVIIAAFAMVAATMWAAAYGGAHRADATACQCQEDSK